MSDEDRLSEFLASLRPYLCAAEQAQVEAAGAWAQARHRGQRRADGASVLAHVVGVAEQVVRFAGRQAGLIVAALLHDVVENTATGLPEIAAAFGCRVAALVEAVTRAPGEAPEVSAERARVAGREALLLRLCDRLDGLQRAAGREAAGRADFLATTRKVYLPLAAQHFPQLEQALQEALAELEAHTGKIACTVPPGSG